MSEETSETTTNSGDARYAYRDRDTQYVYVYDEPHPDLEARPNFERIDPGTVPPSAQAAFERAQAELRSIESSAAIHAQRVEVSADEAARAAGAGATSAPASGPYTPTAANRQAAGVNPPHGVLSRPGAHAVQIGDNPDEHPRTREELLAQAEWERTHPDAVGITQRSELGQRIDDGETATEAAKAVGVPVTEPGTPATTYVGEPTGDGDGDQAAKPARKSTARKATSADKG